MTRRSLIGVALAGTVAATFALGPDAIERHKPAVPEVGSAAHRGGTLVVDLVDGASEADLQKVEAELGVDLSWLSELTVDEALAVGEVPDLAAALAVLRDEALVETAEPELMLSLDPEELSVATVSETLPDGYPNDPLYEKQWHLRAMGAPDGWAHSPRGKGVVVAVVDTGITRVEDLEGVRMLEGASFVPGAKTAADDQGHGTHVAGTIAQATNNGKGCAGVAPEATLLPVKVLSGAGFGSSAWIAAGIDYAVDEGADVINLSLGGGYSSVIHNAIKKAHAKGVIVVAAAGNGGRRGVSWPGALEEAIGVSSVGPSGSLAPYSSYGEGVDIAGPGGDKTKPGGGVFQDTIDGRGGHHYAEYQGTSMATPHVAGAAAVLLSRGMAPDAVERALLETADGDGSWNEKYGHGKLSLTAALGRSVGKHGSTRFALAAVFALLIGQLASTNRSFQIKSAAFAGWVAGGLFLLEYLPLPDLLLTRLIAHPLLSWPALLLGPGFASFPLWLSAALPAVVGFSLGAFRQTRWLAYGLACGVGAHLLHGAATGTVGVSLLPASLAGLWLVANATVAMLVGLGLAGAEKLEEAGRR
ncbi:MAG: peptidase S8 [Alphaproteobacteria bacterium]|nr:peptidase S8 [Alphaproteobacteria bacterium]